ncbi:hypothetical protein GAYE_SCF47G5896 [Galdieria yellowstonensis]|uniref:WHIM1 domain-containing protein n=1 Tax=Galdieria yellowstonensis TaxID=3028027 RepID=A0AAV9IKL5_9RHOD|nr:hypothetical protein GAYE_SCF47G5896 [Galdieria yellowstonensis]
MQHVHDEECIIKTSWEFASIIQFLFAFGKLIQLDRNLVMERLEPLLLLDAVLDPLESYNFKLMSSVHSSLLNQLGRKTSTARTGPRSWLSHLRRELKEQAEFYGVVHVLQTCKGNEEVCLYDCKGVSLLENMDYVSLRPIHRLILLKYLCERVAETSDSIRNYIQEFIEKPNATTTGVHRKRCTANPPNNALEMSNVRTKGIGRDSQGNQFTYFCNQEPNSKSFWIRIENLSADSFHSTQVVSTVEELSEYIAGIENSEALRDRVLAQKLGEILCRISSREDPFPTLQLFRTCGEESEIPGQKRKNEVSSCSFSPHTRFNYIYETSTSKNEETEYGPIRKCRKRINPYIESEDDSEEESLSSDGSVFEVSSDIEMYESDEDSDTGFPCGTKHGRSHPVYYPLMTFASNF